MNNKLIVVITLAAMLPMAPPSPPPSPPSPPLPPYPPFKPKWEISLIAVGSVAGVALLCVLCAFTVYLDQCSTAFNEEYTSGVPKVWTDSHLFYAAFMEAWKVLFLFLWITSLVLSIWLGACAVRGTCAGYHHPDRKTGLTVLLLNLGPYLVACQLAAALIAVPFAHLVVLVRRCRGGGGGGEEERRPGNGAVVATAQATPSDVAFPEAVVLVFMHPRTDSAFEDKA